jgi:putative cell wall-binding protein
VVTSALATLVAVLPLLVPPPIGATAATVDRAAGADRYATAAAISRSAFAGGAPIAFVATGRDFPDSLAGGAAAGRAGGPILLTEESALPVATRDELARLRPATIVVLGGTAVVSSAVESRLRSLTSGDVIRIGGANRFATAAAISARHFAPGAPVAYLATGRSFPDALSAGAAAGRLGGPVLLVDRDAIPGVVRRELTRLAPRRIVVVGGDAVVGSAVVRALDAYTTGSVVRQSGADRYATAAAVSAAAFPADGGGTVHLASGMGFADAVAGVPAAVVRGGPLLLTARTTLPTPTAIELRRLDPVRVTILGGPASVASSMESAVRGATAMARVGPHTFVVDGHGLREVPEDLLAFNSTKLVALYGTRDADGVFVYRHTDGRLYDHPVGQAQYVVNMLRNYRIDSDPLYLDLAVANANRLLERAVRHGGGIFFPYPFDWGLHGRGTLQAPWYSGMAQGIALSGFVRLHELTGDARWLQAAQETFASFLVPRQAGTPWVAVVENGLLWLEEYPWLPYDHTFNGHNFATWGLYDYWRLTGSRDAAEMTMGAMTTSARVAGIVRTPGGISHYCIAQSCLDRAVRNPNYHLTHIGQFIQLFRYTRSETFARLADSFTADNPDFRPGGTVIFGPGTHVGYAFDSTGNGTAVKSLTLDANSNAPYSTRTVPYGWVRPGNGTWFYLSDGHFAGTWIRESSKAFARGFVDRLEYVWNRALAVKTGTWSAYRFDAAGAVTAKASATTEATSWPYSARARINGRPSVYLTGGPLAGYWLPVTGGTSTALSVSSEAIPSVDPGLPQESEGGDVAPPPSAPEDPGIPPPPPGQQEPPTDGPPSGVPLVRLARSGRRAHRARRAGPRRRRAPVASAGRRPRRVG